MALSHQEALERIDGRTLNEYHDTMIDWVNAEVERLDRRLTWDEAFDLLKGKLPLQTDGEYVLNDWLQSTDVPIVCWRIQGFPGVAWGNYATKEFAECVVQDFIDRSGSTSDYDIVLED